MFLAAALDSRARWPESPGPSRLARSSGVDPQVFGIGPVEAANGALARAGVSWGDLDVVELNEAFASQSRACLRS